MHHRATRTYTELGKLTLGGRIQNLVHTSTQEKGAVTPQETDPDLLVSVQESPEESWVGGGDREEKSCSALYEPRIDVLSVLLYSFGPAHQP